MKAPFVGIRVCVCMYVCVDMRQTTDNVYVAPTTTITPHRSQHPTLASGVTETSLKLEIIRV